MTIEMMCRELDRLLAGKDYEAVFCYLRGKEDIVKNSGNLSLFYYLCEINKEKYHNDGEVGILKGKESVKESVDAYLDFKRVVQRVAYCPEYEASNLLKAMKMTGAGPEELLWTVKVATPDPAKVLTKIQGDEDVSRTEIPAYKPKHVYDDVKLDFIICSNDPRELDETLFYIGRLAVPEGVTIDVLSIGDATSMCAGYNEAMQVSQAKYKVYMHHDVRIIEQNFIPMLLDAFMDREDVGLIGMIGTKKFPSDGVMWHANRFGSVIDTHVHETLELRKYPENKAVDGLLCDGLLLATQYDLPWREDLFDAWDFYDASQCMEFHRAGYGIMIPYQSKTWCVHDCGFSNLSKYDKYREVFLKEYEKDAEGMIEIYAP